MNNSDYQRYLTELDQHYAGDTNSPRAKKVRNLIYALPCGDVLDIGCADGALLKGLPSSYNLTGLDISDINLTKAQANGYTTTVLGNAEKPLPFSKSSFDILVLAETLEHIVDTDHVLQECYRVLKPNGTLILTLPNIRTFLGLAMLIYGLPPMFAARYQRGHVRDWTLPVIEEALEVNHFIEVQSYGTCIYLPKIGDCFGSIFQFFPSWSSTIVTTAKKNNDNPLG